MKPPFLFLVTAVLLLTDCNQPVESDPASGGGGTIETIDHTHRVINHFNANGQSSVDIIGPWRGGGDAGYFGVPSKWEPGIAIKIERETGEAPTDGFLGYDHWDEYPKWEKKIKASHIEHTAIVPMPDCDDQKTRGVKVYFLPCDKVKMTTGCYDYGNPNYPVKDPIKMEESKVCPEQIQGCQDRVSALCTRLGSEPIFSYCPSTKAC